MIIFNDWHLGVNRAAGTTPASAAELKAWMFQVSEDLLGEVNEDLVILGDLFDSYNVSNLDLLITFHQLTEWKRKGHKLHMVQGNHDVSNDSSKMSSFHLLCELLEVIPVTELTEIAPEVWVLPHVLNQDIFDSQLAKVPKCRYLLLHCNYDNNFAVGSDHSLNITKAQVEALPVDVCIFAHEHYARNALQGKVFVAGNQFPSSISDCLGEMDKTYTRIGVAGVERLLSWGQVNYAEITWDAQEPTEANFVRLVGTCEPERAAALATAVAAYRRTSTAFVVSNAVQVGTSKELAEIGVTSLEGLRQFNVMEALKEYVTEAEFKTLESLT